MTTAFVPLSPFFKQIYLSPLPASNALRPFGDRIFLGFNFVRLISASDIFTSSIKQLSRATECCTGGFQFDLTRKGCGSFSFPWCMYFTKEITIFQSQGSQQEGWVRGYEGHKLAGIAKMADRLFADRVVLPVTAAIYRNGEENQQCVGPLKWKTEAKVTRCCLILFFE